MKTLFTTVLFVLIAFGTAGAQWTPQTSGTTSLLYSVSAVDNNVVWACGAAGTVVRTTDGGATWTNVSAAPVTGDLYNVFAIDVSNALVTNSGASATVWKTTNGGATWDQVFVQSGGFINVIEIGAGGTGFMEGDPVGGRWSLWKTTDSGTSWDSTGMYLPQAGSEAGWNNSVYMTGTSSWFGTSNSRIYNSVNGGLTWTAQSTSQANSYSVFFSGLVGLAGGTDGMKTTNGGLNWSAQTITGSGNINGIAASLSTFWAIRGTNVYKSTDDGATWTTDYTATGALSDLAIARSGNRLWAVGATGGIYMSEGLLSVDPISSNLPERYSLSQNYPNPFNPTSKIRFDISKADFVTLKVYNTLGQEVTKLVNENLQPGTYEVTFDGAGLNSGIYFYTIKAGDFVETKKMMLVK